jgi:hypothetical protein
LRSWSLSLRSASSSFWAKPIQIQNSTYGMFQCSLNRLELWF